MSDLDALAADLATAGIRADVVIRPVVVKGALNVQTDARDLASGHRRLGAYPFSITFDVDGDGLGAEIGPDKEKPQGPLGNIVEYGTSKNAPMPHLGPAFDREEPRFEEHVAEAVAKAIL